MDRTIRIYTTRWCPDCWRAKQFLNRHGLQFEEVNIEEVPEAVEFVTNANEGKRRVPTFEMEGKVFHCSSFYPVRLKSDWVSLETLLQASDVDIATHSDQMPVVRICCIGAFDQSERVIRLARPDLFEVFTLPRRFETAILGV